MSAGWAQGADNRSARDADWLAGAPLFQGWRAFAEADVAPFTIPGHKRRAGRLDPALGRLLDADVPLYGGAGTVKLAVDLLRQAEELAARLWGADLCRFSTGGSTHANQVLCLALGRPQGAAIVGRNAHRSIVSGLALAGLRPVWLPVRTDPRTRGPLGVDPAEARAALARTPDAVGLWVTEPGYQGVIGDRAALAGAAHDHGVPLVVDQAWGAHLGFAEPYPAHALSLGADAVVTSAHKMLPAFSQASLLLVRGDRIDASRVDRAIEATHTTSPSASILASIDASRALLGSPLGRDLLVRMAALVADARDRLRAAGLTVPGPQDHPPGRFDPAKLVVHLRGTAHSGLQVEQALLRRGVAVEMADRDCLIAQVGLTDEPSTVARLVEGVLAACNDPVGRGAPGPTRRLRPEPAAGGSAGLPTPLPPQRLTPREAFLSGHETVGRDAALGRIAAELVAAYPPGIPVLVPGEVITAETLAHLDDAMAAGNRIAYAADPTLATFQVVPST